MSLINKFRNTNRNKYEKLEGSKYVSSFINLSIETLEGEDKHAIKYDKVNKRYVMLSNKKSIKAFESEESLLEYVKFYLENYLELHAMYITVELGSIKDYNQPGPDGRIQKYIYSQDEYKRIDLEQYHDYDKEEFAGKELIEKVFTHVPNQLEVIPSVLSMIKTLTSVIKHMLFKNGKKYDDDKDIEIELFIRENEGE